MLQGLIRGLTIAGGGACPTASAFLARTSGLDATHTNAYNALICGLVDDGIWTKLDMLHIYATQDSTTALLNLVSTSYNGIANGPPAFTADQGFTGIHFSGTVYIDTNFNPSTAVSAQFTRNSSHISAWSYSSAALESIPMMGVSKVVNATNIDVFPQYTDGKAYFFCNDPLPGLSVVNATRTGHFMANRSGANDLQGYLNGSSIVSSGASPSVALTNGNIYCVAQNQDATFGSTCQQAAASIGSSLSAGEVTLFYTRLRTYMTAVGVP